MGPHALGLVGLRCLAGVGAGGGVLRRSLEGARTLDSDLHPAHACDCVDRVSLARVPMGSAQANFRPPARRTRGNRVGPNGSWPRTSGAPNGWVGALRAVRCLNLPSPGGFVRACPQPVPFFDCSSIVGAALAPEKITRQQLREILGGHDFWDEPPLAQRLFGSRTRPKPCAWRSSG